MNPKDKKIIENGEAQGIPIFVFTAKDRIAVSVLQHYVLLCRAEDCPEAHISEIKARIDEFKEWTKNNPEKMKNPD